MLVDVWSKGVTGKKAEQALDAAGITVNKNMIPYDTRQPMDPSGIRIGTPALTTRGMKESGNAADRQVDYPSAGEAGRRRDRWPRSRRGASDVPAVPSADKLRWQLSSHAERGTENE